MRSRDDASPDMRRVLLLGATGLIGGHVLQRLLEKRTWRVLAPVRQPLPVSDPLLQSPLCEPAGDAGRAALRQAMHDDGGVAALVCCLGSTAHAAGSKQAFAAIDRDLVLHLASDARSAGADHAIVVSSVGADIASRNFYLRIKGEMEAGMAALGFRRCDLLRPGLLLGTRHERRPLEALGQHLLPRLNPLLAGRLRRYRAIQASTVAAAAVALLATDVAGTFVHENALLESPA
jgi:uncharacterized protein YbjT (DUF2867 family)